MAIIRKSRAQRRRARAGRIAGKKARVVPPFYLKRKFQWYVAPWTWGTATTADFWKFLSITPNSAIGSLPSSGIPGWTNYATLFEQYRIKAIKYTFRPQYNVVNQPSSATVTPTQTLSYLTTCVDPEANTGPAGVYSSAALVSLQADGRTKTREFTRSLSLYIKNPMYYQDAGGISAALRKRAGWVNTGYNPEHRGAHVFWHQVNFDNNPMVMDVYCTVYAEFKGMNAA